MKRHISKRIVIHVGFSCNERCVFCYYRDSLAKGDVKDLTLEQIKKRLRIGRKFGKNEVDLSGGEPTIRKDIFEIIRYAKKIGYTTVAIITNGLMLAKKEFCEKLVDAGLNDILFSLHGPDREMHDYLTSVKGSYDKLMKGMDYMSELGINLRINTVISNLNYKQLDNYFLLVKKFKPNAINLLIFNPAEEVINYKTDDVTVENYSLIGEELVKALDKHSKNFNKINIRFLPFCLVKGHEDKIKTMWQKIYEREEWDPFLFMRFRKNDWYAYSFPFAGFFIALFKYKSYKVPYTGKKSFYTYFCELIQCARIYYNKKHASGCKNCALKEICPGLPKAYVKKFKKAEVFPYEGKKIQDPSHFDE